MNTDQADKNKPFALEEYNKQILQPMLAKCAGWELQPYEEWKKDAEFYGYIPPTRWQRFKHNWYSYWSQYKYIWWIVIGKNIHEDCGY